MRKECTQRPACQPGTDAKPMDGGIDADLVALRFNLHKRISHRLESARTSGLWR